MNFTSLFESSAVKGLIAVVSAFQKANPYPDYGVLYWNDQTQTAIYNVGDGQEGDLEELRSNMSKVPGVKEAQVADECGRPAGFRNVWHQGKLE